MMLNLIMLAWIQTKSERNLEKWIQSSAGKDVAVAALRRAGSKSGSYCIRTQSGGKGKVR